jgi:hypothetical protein
MQKVVESHGSGAEPCSTNVWEWQTQGVEEWSPEVLTACSGPAAAPGSCLTVVPVSWIAVTGLSGTQIA